MKVAKFGGTSLASAEQIRKVFRIVTSDPKRKIIVVSAPGKRYAKDTKITDLLIACGRAILGHEEATFWLEQILERYSEIANELGLGNEIIMDIRENLYRLVNNRKNDPLLFMEALKASGEDFHARLIARYFQKEGVEASYVHPAEAGLLLTGAPGNAKVLPESYGLLRRLRDRSGLIIFPGFFGSTKNGDILTFSRSGSDITGAILAVGVQAELYENFTDVDAVYSVNPALIPHPKKIKEITFREMRELSYAGFSVIHDEALIPAFRAGIPVHIRNTNHPEAPGTKIVKTRQNTNGPVIGIASDSGFCSLFVSKYLMNRELGFGRRLLQILEDYQISFEHIPSGIDELTVILREHQLTEAVKKDLIERIEKDLHPDSVAIEQHLSLIMMVGEGMRQTVGTAARAAKALSLANINIEMINQGSSEVSMMFGVKEAVEVEAVRALYHEFFETAHVGTTKNL